MKNTTMAEMIEGIRNMDRTLGLPKRTGLSKLRRADLIVLHGEVLDNFLKVTQPEVDRVLEEDFYRCEQCGGENVLKASREAHEQRVHGTVAKQEANLEEMRKESGLEGYYDEPYQQDREKQHQREADEWFKRQQAAKGPSSGPVVARPATGPQITVVAKVGRRLVLGVIIGTVTRPAMMNRNLVTVQHLGDDGKLLPRVTLHAASEVAA